MEYNKILTGLFGRLSGLREERPSAGLKYQLLGIIGETIGMIGLMKQDVLRRVSQEAVIDADVDVDYGEMAELALQSELPEPAASATEAPLAPVLAETDLQEHLDEGLMASCARIMEEVDGLSLRQLIALENVALGELNHVLTKIADELERSRKPEEYARLYEAELKRYNASGTARRAKKNYEKWKDNECYGEPTLDDLEGYRLCKLLRMFEKKVFETKVAMNQRCKRYPDEVDFSQIDDDHPLKKTAYKHYSALRKMVDYNDGNLVVDPAHVGQHFYVSRKDANAKANRTSFLKYMHKIELAQDDRRRLLAAQAEAARRPQLEAPQLNYYAPTRRLKELLKEEWFGMLATDDEKYNAKWTDDFVDALMASEWRDHIAREWDSAEKRLSLKCMIVGALKDACVLKGSYNSIARLLDMDDENTATLAKYMGMGKKQPFAEWITEYVNS